MVKKNGKKAGVTLGLAISLLGSVVVSNVGCALIPVEEDARTAQVVAAAEAISYRVEQASIGDVVNSVNIRTTYQQKRESEIKFSVKDKWVKKVYVKTGDTVKKGDVLAMIDLGDLLEQKEDLLREMSETQKAMSDSYELEQIDLAILDLKNQDGQFETPEDYAEAVKDLQESYYQSMEPYTDTLYVDEMRLNEYEQKIAEAYIYADMDGTVSYINPKLKQTATDPENVAVRIIDTTECHFVGETEYAQYMTEGQSATLTNSSTSYETILHIGEENEDKKTIVTFESADPSQVINVGVDANYSLELARADQVVCVSSKAVHKSGAEYFVYALDENGVRITKPVTVGVIGNTLTEITSGLEAGDTIVLQ